MKKDFVDDIGWLRSNLDDQKIVQLLEIPWMHLGGAVFFLFLLLYF